MFKALLVDDEALEREGIRSLIPWLALGIELAGEAPGATKALAIARDIQPDILITDIRMPGKSGIELAAQIKTFLPDVKVIFISGYQDFQYARRAIALDADGYVLKPVNETELIAVLQKTVDRLQKNESDAAQRAAARRQWEESLPIIRQQYLRALLEGAPAHGQTRTDCAGEGFPCNPGTFYAAALSFDGGETDSSAAAELPRRFVRIWQSIAGGDATAEAVMMRDGLCALVVNAPAGQYEAVPVMASVMQEAIVAYKAAYGGKVSMGLSAPGRTPGELCRLYEQAQRAEKQKWHAGKGVVIAAGQFCEMPEEKPDYTRDIADVQKKINRHMIEGSAEAVATVLRDFFDSLSDSERKNPLCVRNYCLILINGAENMLTMRGENLDGGFQNRAALVDELLLADTLAETQAWMIERFADAARFILRENSNPGKALVNKIIDMIESRYAQELTVSAFAREVFLSPNYIRRIFKKETGKTVLEYITDVRMQRATELMRKAPISIKEIAEKVGFENTSYFGLIFKQYYGVTPGEYMKSIKRL